MPLELEEKKNKSSAANGRTFICREMMKIHTRQDTSRR
ncbi:hypothetical protein STRDD11_02138 [Streptococcus sp. DD11]|nr:hypothetical protein STRDD11_02138 [Streptococcus sp. DD11]